ncbi:MAG: response regulator [Vallitaleaceae bacterium]|jgi:two-component system cell cycle sensor histidine kinase/response regulator CckA|nr:response regulator [Vallitaleaceae bacterium]
MVDDKKIRILVIDDEAIIRDLLKDILEMLNYEVLITGSPKEAIQIFASEHKSIHLVILDMIMPEMNGRQLFRELKCIKPSVKGILLSGYSLEGEVEKSLSEGIIDFLQKPVSIKELSSVLQRITNLDPM